MLYCNCFLTAFSVNWLQTNFNKPVCTRVYMYGINCLYFHLKVVFCHAQAKDNNKQGDLLVVVMHTSTIKTTIKSKKN